jgi:hypothetical protein
MYGVMQHVGPIYPHQKKNGVKIDGICIVSGKVALIPIVSSSETILRNRD